MPENFEDIINNIKVSIEDPNFYQKVFTAISRFKKSEQVKLNDILKICSEEYDDLSRRLDKTEIQASTAVRNVLRTRQISILLFSDKGELYVELLSDLIACLEQSLYSIGPDRQYDAVRQEHLLKVLKTLRDSKEMQRLLKNVGKPYANKYADEIIRETLGLPANSMITDADAKRAALSAWMCYLRQNVGSCFATAPAIIIHDEQPDQMFLDIIEILGTGRLKRTFGGIEYSVPISSSWGAGDLKKPFLLPLDATTYNLDLWVSPGLIYAFEEAGLIDSKDTLKERIEKNKSLILDAISTWDSQSPFVITNAEEVIKRVLLKDLGITQQNLDDYEKRPKNFLQTNLMMQTATIGGGIGQICANFYVRFEAAQNGFKSIADNALLKAWEFTLASFAEMKAQFTRWNLYSSLGLGAQEEGGIGQALYQVLKEKVEESNRKIAEFQGEYEIAYQQIKYLEARIRSASSEKEAQWIKAEYQSKRNEFDMLEEMRNRYHRRGERFANLFDVLIGIYDELFPRYFQEVYDADMHEISSGPYDDSPAGFRLLYKHGRSNTSQWTRIRTPNEFIDALTSFFNNTESEVSAAPQLAGLESDITEMITGMVSQIRTQEFLETAFYRMARAHQTPLIKDPLQNLDRIEKKPWAYTSGGTMGTLVSCYYRTESLPTEVGRWVESPTELLVFLIDTVKQIPPKLMEGFDRDENKSLLIHSPTHAFLLKPGKKLFKEAIDNDLFTYTYVRDMFILPMEKFIRKIDLEESMQEYLIRCISKKVHPDFQYYFKQVFSDIAGKKDPVEFRNMVIDTMSKERGLRFGRNILNPDDIDSLLFSALPLFPVYELKSRIEEILNSLKILPPQWHHEIATFYERFISNNSDEVWMDAKQLQDITKALICLASRETSLPFDCHMAVSEAAKALGYSMPMPVIFADTNWAKDEFAFNVNPGTGRFELWRVDSTGTVGAPMSSWERWLNGSERTHKWGVYIRPYEYRR